MTNNRHPRSGGFHVTSADLANPDHAAAVLHLLEAYARDPMGGGGALSDYARTHLITRLRERSGVHVLLVCVDDVPAGLAICMEGFSTFACQPLLNIHDFAVLPEFRGQGLARALLAAVEEKANTLGCCKITLEVLEGNAPARALYQAVGFAGYELNPALGKAVFLQKVLAD